ncbi:MAG: hypothetical protein EZS28_016138 [Streblomastix strix]|uniref:Uncharacterized protein n=1 Tax=Streblomastix strix TaxID=222440 RepID=A0A5J4W063_9EUKA|nr:MAG: hypothetical protein EZS28_016138 [Streblomastix strix]
MNIPISQQQIRTVRQLITNDIAYYIQYSKRGGSSGGMLSNEEYQLFIDNSNALVYAANNQIIDGMASDYALKIEPNGLLTIKNLKVINFDFVAQINQLINQVNLLQQSIGTTEQDITDIKNDFDTINQELSRQTHFRGYYLLNTDIQNLPNSANGDFAFSAESGTVWMYDQNWYNSGDIVPDQVTPASDALPIVDGTAAAGISTEYSRGDHVHPLNITTTIPISDSASGSVGTTNYYTRSDHSHPINISATTPLQDSASGSVGTTNYYARNDHSHPINVETNASNIPVVNGVGANGTSSLYARQDHIHPQQLTYDGNVTATKFIKTGGLTTEVLCANGDTKAISDIVSNYVDLTTNQTISGVKTYDSLKKTNGTNQQILLADGTNKSITDFNTSVAPRSYQIDPADGIYWMCFAVLNISNFTSNGSYGCTMDINTIYVNDLFYQIKWNLRIQNGYNRRFEATQFGSIQTDFMICADTPETSLILRFYMKVFTNSAYILFNINLSQFSNSNVRDNFVLQDNINQQNITTDTLPTGSLFTSTVIQNQFINQGGIINGMAQINPNTANYSQGLRISRSVAGCGIYLGTGNNINGTVQNQWQIVSQPSNFEQNPLGLTIGLSSESGAADRGLRISADGNTLSFNGSVIAGTGSSNGASNGSVNYSAGNPILWGQYSNGTEGGFYSDGSNVYWRARSITLGSVAPS